jgi:hypothetical protein
MFAFFTPHDVGKLVLILGLKYSIRQMTLILDLHMIYRKIVMILLQQIKLGTAERAKAVHQFSASNSGLNHVVALRI